MTTAGDYRIEPELHLPTPRRTTFILHSGAPAVTVWQFAPSALAITAFIGALYCVAGVAMGWIYAPFVPGFASLSGAALAIRQFRKRSIVRDGRAASGTITRKFLDRGPGTDTFHLEYEFLPAGDRGARIGADEVSKETYQQLRAGDSLTVVYLPNNPAISAIYASSGVPAVPRAYRLLRPANPTNEQLLKPAAAMSADETELIRVSSPTGGASEDAINEQV